MDLKAPGFPAMRRPVAMPELRVWIHRQWQPGELFWQVAQATRHHRRLPGQEWVHFEAMFDDRAVETAELYWVTDEMCQLIDVASRSLLPTTLTKELMPAPSGLVWFERPLVGTASQIDTGMPTDIPVRALLWGESLIPPGPHPAVGISTYAMYRETFAPAGRTDWEFGEDTDEPIDPAIADDKVRVDSMAEDRRWLATFWLLLSQTGIADTSTVRSLPKVIRKGKRTMPGLTSNDFDVRIVNVHKPKSSVHNVDSPGGREVNWSHRWPVRPHWRQQAYGPNHSLRRPQLIPPYIKGPADKPLKIKDTVHLLKDGEI